MFGWGLEGEDQCVRDASRAGLEVIAANWSYNLPLFASDPAPVLPQTVTPPPTATHDDANTRYVAFIESDGDNITWTMSDFATASKFYNNPARGSLPYGWSMAISTLAVLGPDAWDYYAHARDARRRVRPDRPHGLWLS